MRFFGRKKKEEKERREERQKQSKERGAGNTYFEYEGPFFKIVGHLENPVEEIAPGHYKVKHVTSGAGTSETGQINAGEVNSEERREEAMKSDPPNRDEILLEILRELKELNSNMKALIVRVDAGREEIRQLAEDMYVRLKQKLDDMTMGMGGW